MTKKAKANDFSITSGNGVMSGKAKAIRWLISIILIIYTCFTIFVIGATLLNSLKTKSDLVTNFVGLPKSVTLANFATILLEDDFLLYFRNSLILTVCGTVGCILLSAMAAYGIARYEFKGKSFLSSYFLIGMMVPIQVSVSAAVPDPETVRAPEPSAGSGAGLYLADLHVLPDLPEILPDDPEGAWRNPQGWTAAMI